MAIDVKQLFAGSMLKLLKERSFDEVTVKDLCTDCGASRQTFYNHFLDKYDLILWICRKQYEELWATFQKERSFRACMMDVYGQMYANQRFYSVVMDIEGPNSFRDFLVRFTKDYYRGAIRAQGRELTDELDYALNFCTIATIEMAVNWVKEGFARTPEQMVDYQIACCPAPLREYI